MKTIRVMGSFVVEAEDKEDAINKVEDMINNYYQHNCLTTPIVKVMVEGYERGMHLIRGNKDD